jgi:cytochrome c biogenesis protein CcmG, thiol:disulfide interchange protein DsbE
MRKIIYALVLGMFLVSGSACGKKQEESGLGSRKPAIDFSVKELNSGKEIKLSDLKGKVVMLDFWATWCPPCRMSVPHMRELQEEYKDQGFEILGISMDTRGGEKVVTDFIKQYSINYLVGWDPQGSIAVKWAEISGPIRGIPTAFFIDRKGKVAEKMEGYHGKEKLRASIKALLEE